MFQPENVDHVIDHIAADLCVRYPEVPCERIEAIVADARKQIESENHHPEFIGALVEHAAKDVIHSFAGAPEPATGVTC